MRRHSPGARAVYAHFKIIYETSQYAIDTVGSIFNIQTYHPRVFPRNITPMLRILLVLSLLFPLTAEAAAPLSSRDTRTMLSIHNSLRAEVGVSKLTNKPALARTALSYAQTMESRGCALEHSNAEERNYAGENLYARWSYGAGKTRMSEAVWAW
jgi:hypothetical protein